MKVLILWYGPFLQNLLGNGTFYAETYAEKSHHVKGDRVELAINSTYELLFIIEAVTVTALKPQCIEFLWLYRVILEKIMEGISK